MTTKTKRPPPSQSVDHGYNLDGEVCDPSLATPDNSMMIEQMKQEQAARNAGPEAAAAGVQEQMSMADGLAGVGQGVLDMVANGSDRERAAPGADARKVARPVVNESLARRQVHYQGRVKELERKIMSIHEVGKETAQKMIVGIKNGIDVGNYEGLKKVGVEWPEARKVLFKFLQLRNVQTNLKGIKGIGDKTSDKVIDAIIRGQSVETVEDLKKLDGIGEVRARKIVESGHLKDVKSQVKNLGKPGRLLKTLKLGAKFLTWLAVYDGLAKIWSGEALLVWDGAIDLAALASWSNPAFAITVGLLRNYECNRPDGRCASDVVANNVTRKHAAERDRCHEMGLDGKEVLGMKFDCDDSPSLLKVGFDILVDSFKEAPETYYYMGKGVLSDVGESLGKIFEARDTEFTRANRNNHHFGQGKD